MDENVDSIIIDETKKNEPDKKACNEEVNLKEHETSLDQVSEVENVEKIEETQVTKVMDKLELSNTVTNLFNLSEDFEDANAKTFDTFDNESDDIMSDQDIEEKENLRTDLTVGLPEISPIPSGSRTRSGRCIKKRLSTQIEDESSEESVDEDEYHPNGKEDQDSESSSDEDVEQVSNRKGQDDTPTENTSGNLQASTSNERCLTMNQIVPYSSEGGKWYQKKNFCYYCHTMQTRIDIHLKNAHLDKPEVLQASLMKPKSKERRNALGAIRLKGNDFYNKNKTFNPEGKIIASRRQRVSKNGTPLKPKTTKNKAFPIKMMCPYCDIYPAYKNLQNHVRNTHGVSHFSNTKNTLGLSKKKMGLCHLRASDLVKDHILPKLKMDSIGAVARMDLMIILYANKFVIRYMNIDQQAYVRAHMRLLAKLLIAITSINSKLTDLIDVFRPVYWPIVLDAIKLVSEYDAKTNRFAVIYNAETIPILLRKCIKILKNEFTVHEDKEKLEYLLGFESVFEDDVEVQIAYTANIGRKEFIRHGEEKKLPETEHIYTFEKFLSYKRNLSMKHFDSGKSEYEHYLNIMQTTAVRILIYNRRRPGEVSKTLLKDYAHAKAADPSSEFFKRLTEEEQKQRLKYTRIDIQGKKADGKGSLYITDEDKTAIELLLRYRQVFRINPSNIYLFALPNDATGVDRHVKISELLTKLSKECSQTFKEMDDKTMRGNLLRQHIATYNSTTKDGEKNRTTLTGHLGHSEKVHNKHYRRTIDGEDVLVTQILDSASKMNDKDNTSNISEFDESSITLNSSVVDSITSELEASLNAVETSEQDSTANSSMNVETDDSEKHYVPLSDFRLSSKRAKSFKSQYEPSPKKAKLHESKSMNPPRKSQSKIKKSKESKNSSMREMVTKKNFATRRTWNEDEKTQFEKAFEMAICTGRYPTATEIRDAQKKYPSLAERSEQTIRTRFSNHYRKNEVIKNSKPKKYGKY